MQSNRPRRVHSPQLKEAVVAECRQPGASVSGVALAHGLNANLVRKWLIGRGLGRTGLGGSSAKPSRQREVIASATATVARPMRFVPVALAGAERGAAAEPVPEPQAQIHIELKRGGAQLTVRWPSSQAGACATWLSELAGAMRK